MPVTYIENGITYTQPTQAELSGQPVPGAHYIPQPDGKVGTQPATKKTTTKKAATTVPKKEASAPAPTNTVPATTIPYDVTPVQEQPNPLPHYNLSPPFNPWTMVIIPLFMLAVLITLFFKWLAWSYRKYPIYRGFAHKHKHVEPGKPKPKILK